MITVVGSVNLDIVARGASLPAPGETVTGAQLQRFPGGKGANQALAAKRLGADVRLVAAVGADEFAEEALVLLRKDGVDLSSIQSVNGETTGVALIAIDASGENQIIVASGANAALRAEDASLSPIEHMIGVLEVSPEVITAAANHASGLVVVNLAPAQDVPPALLERADVLVVNETEAAFYGEALNQTNALVALTLGANGAALIRKGKEIACSQAQNAPVVDTVGAGDTFTAAIAVALIEGMSEKDALNFAVWASALAVTKMGAQTSLPWRSDVNALPAP